MKTRFLFFLSLVCATSVGTCVALSAEVELTNLVQRCLPNCRFQTDAAGQPQAVVSASGEVLDLDKATRENPEPADGVGYRESPTMQFLSRQNIKAVTADEAADAVRLLHVLWRGSGFVRQKTYEARPIEGGWVIRVEHDFTKYPGRIQEIMPYELLVEERGRITRLRERCYFFTGSAVVYTNTVSSVYEREKTNRGGLYYPEALEKELRKASEVTKPPPSEGPGKQPGKGQ